jgi:hypothetical protein
MFTCELNLFSYGLLVRLEQEFSSWQITSPAQFFIYRSQEGHFPPLFCVLLERPARHNRAFSIFLSAQDVLLFNTDASGDSGIHIMFERAHLGHQVGPGDDLRRSGATGQDQFHGGGFTVNQSQDLF